MTNEPTDNYPDSDAFRETPETRDEMSREYGRPKARIKRAMSRVKHFAVGRNQPFIPTDNRKPPF